MIVNPWFVLLIRTLAFLFLSLAAAVVISIVNPVLSMDRMMAYMQGMAAACMSSSLMSSMVWQTMQMSEGQHVWASLMLAIGLVSFGMVPLLWLWGLWLRFRGSVRG